ncbi:hypothetical protein [Azospirillum sp.]|uniref:hypothetical protein n=1 Tax=Azospirillum sp. TaxID=34012 RepID=UPI00261EF185|nr:hypothetical protein [Azospirillum sp.]
MTTHPPMPRLALPVGVTGHRPNRLSEAARALVAAQIATALREIAAVVNAVHQRHAAVFSPQTPRLTLLSALAEGADRIAADAALEAGWRLDALLPFPRDEYAADFSDADTQTAYRALLERADAVLELPGRREAAPRAYEEAGLAILDHCAILIAVWDGAPSAGRGGTVEIIDAAARRGLPVLWIDARGIAPPQLRWSGLTPHPLPVSRFDDLPAQDPDHWLARVVEDTLRPPTDPPADPDDANAHGDNAHGAETDEAGRLAAYFGEKRRRYHGRPEWQCLLAIGGVRRLRCGDLHGPTPEEAAADARGVPARLPDPLTAAYGWADALAVRYAQIFRSAIVTNFLFAALSVFIVALSILSQYSFHRLEHHKWAFVLIELLLIVGVIWNTRAGKRAGWHRRWLEAREVAERLRVAFPLIGLGGLPPLPSGRVGIWTAWYTRALLRAAGAPTLALSGDALAVGRAALVAMLEDQRRYHEGVRDRMARMEHRLERFGETLFLATLVVAALYLLSAALGVEIAKEVKFAVTALTAGLPVLATASYGIRVIADFEGNAHRSGRMAQQLATLIAAIHGDNPANPWAARARARQAGEIMLGDVANWRLTAEGRGLAIPG